jgi:agmatine/peptidylarginine deiminase
MRSLRSCRIRIHAIRIVMLWAVALLISLPGASAGDAWPYVPVPDLSPVKQVIFTLGKLYCQEEAPFGGGANWQRHARELLGAARVVSRQAPVVLFFDAGCRALVEATLPPSPRITRVETPITQIWARDSGPFWVRNLGTGRLEILDLPYKRAFQETFGFPIEEDTLPTRLGRWLKIPARPVEQTYSEKWREFLGGNLQVDLEGNCFLTDIDSPQLHAEYLQVLQKLGCRKPRFLLPLLDDATKHVDLFFMLAGPRRAFVAEFPDPRSKDIQARMNLNYRLLHELGYQLIKVPQPHPEWIPPFEDCPNGCFDYRSHVNSLVLGRHVFLPEIGNGADPAARRAVTAAGYTVHPVPLKLISGQGGSLHCITKTIPQD